MEQPRFRVDPLGHHDRATFSCGVESLDRYLKQQAGQDLRRRLAAVFVLVDTAQPDPAAVIGYYTLSAFAVDASAVPSEFTRKLGRYPILPAALLGRLAVDRRYQGQRLGESLLYHALRQVVRQSQEIAIRAVVVDALDEHAADFYARNGFLRFRDHPRHLFVPIETIRSL